MAYRRGHTTGTKREQPGATDWYASIQAAHLARIEAEAAQQETRMDILTQHQIDTLINRGQAVMMSQTTLTTRTAHYAWSDEAQIWEATHTGLRVRHTTGADDRGYCYSIITQRFMRCPCARCAKRRA